MPADDAEAATIACYAPLQVEISDGAHFRWYFGDIVSDDADKGGSGDTDEPDLLEFENFFGDPSSGIVLGEWKTAYKGICLLYTSPSPRDRTRSRMPSSA